MASGFQAFDLHLQTLLLGNSIFLLFIQLRWSASSSVPPVAQALPRLFFIRPPSPSSKYTHRLFTVPLYISSCPRRDFPYFLTVPQYPSQFAQIHSYTYFQFCTITFPFLHLFHKKYAPPKVSALWGAYHGAKACALQGKTLFAA